MSNMEVIQELSRNWFFLVLGHGYIQLTNHLVLKLAVKYLEQPPYGNCFVLCCRNWDELVSENMVQIVQNFSITLWLQEDRCTIVFLLHMRFLFQQSLHIHTYMYMCCILYSRMWMCLLFGKYINVKQICFIFKAFESKNNCFVSKCLYKFFFHRAYW